MKKLLTVIIALLSVFSAKAQEPDSIRAAQEKVLEDTHISLLTCSGYDEIWALYGHSALRVQVDGRDFAVNYGLFDFQQPNFIGRFVFGKCDYLMGFVPFDEFLYEFSSRGASVYQQEINLTNPEKLAVLQALDENARPENREYRYNYFYDNCATRPRDIILNNIPDSIVYNNASAPALTFRQMIHSHNGQKPWGRMGKDMLLGVGADRPTTRAEQQFLPDNLKADFAKAVFVDAQGHRRPVVLKSEWVLRGEPVYTSEFPLSPTNCGLLFFIALFVVYFIEKRKKKTYWQLDALLLALCGLVGIVLFVMIFSEHPTVSCNLLILAFNPLLLVFWWRMVQELRGKKQRKIACGIYTASLIVCFLLTCLTITRFIGLHLQDAPEGIGSVITALMLRMLLITRKYH